MSQEVQKMSAGQALLDKPFIETALNELLEKLASAETMDQICQAFVSTHGGDATILGAVMHGFGPSGDLNFEGSFGQDTMKLKSFTEELQSENLLYTMTRPAFFPVSGECPRVCIPVKEKSLVSGVLVVAVKLDDDSTFSTDENLIEVLVTRSLTLAVSKVRSLRDGRLPKNATGKEMNALSTRQLVILRHMSDGMTNTKIAELLFVSQSTVRHETIKIFSFLEVPNRKLAIEAAVSQGLI